jgi:hypothetical protein
MKRHFRIILRCLMTLCLMLRLLWLPALSVLPLMTVACSSSVVSVVSAEHPGRRVIPVCAKPPGVPEDRDIWVFSRSFEPTIHVSDADDDDWIYVHDPSAPVENNGLMPRKYSGLPCTLTGERLRPRTTTTVRTVVKVQYPAPAPVPGVSPPPPPPPEGNDYKSQKASLEWREAAAAAERAGFETGRKFGEAIGEAEGGLQLAYSIPGYSFRTTVKQPPSSRCPCPSR